MENRAQEIVLMLFLEQLNEEVYVTKQCKA